MSELNRAIFSGMQILLENKWVQDQAVIIENDKITAIIPKEMISHHLPARRYVYPHDCYLIPGLIDLHIHGVHGRDVMDGTEQTMHDISRALAREGVTGYLATTMTADKERIETALKSVVQASSSDEGARILGIHLEGPFIAKDKMGAQSGESIQEPDIQLFQHWQNMACDTIKLVTLAPELHGAIPFIQYLHKTGVIASIGHTNATFAETMTAITAGCTQATHLFNAMSGMHQREPGSVTALLLSEQIRAELIVDGLHLHPAIVELVFKLKSKERLLLVTDAMRATCLGDGDYELGGQLVKVKAGKAALENGTLAGSTLRMPQAIKNMVQFSHCSLSDAIYMASYNPAKVLGLQNHKGVISLGKDADLVVLNANLDVLLALREGREVFQG